MDNNEIKSFKDNISLKLYLMLDNVITDNIFQVGNIKYNKVSCKLVCYDCKDSNNTLLLLGRNYNRASRYLFETSIGIIECELDNIFINVELVLKKQISHLKYKEQLDLFKDGEKSNG